ncbi:MAG: hypothetical protein EOO36_11160 [Cytophagaceae bacterium]|nr:MAG: hypothetical protein EOO36_11160 [Cytophagaceae bacterium]
MLPFSAAQIALNQLLHQRLRDASCYRGRFDVSAPGTYFSLSGEKPEGGTLFFWEFGEHFHQVVADYLRENYNEHTAQLTVQVDVAKEEFSYSHLTKQQQAAHEAAEKKRVAERRPGAGFQSPYRPGASSS